MKTVMTPMGKGKVAFVDRLLKGGIQNLPAGNDVDLSSPTCRYGIQLSEPNEIGRQWIESLRFDTTAIPYFWCTDIEEVEA